MKFLGVLVTAVLCFRISLAQEYYSPTSPEDLKVLNVLRVDGIPVNSTFKITEKAKFLVINAGEYCTGINGNCRICAAEVVKESLIIKAPHDYIIYAISKDDGSVNFKFLSTQKRNLILDCDVRDQNRAAEFASASSESGIEFKVLKLKEAELKNPKDPRALPSQDETVTQKNNKTSNRVPADKTK